MTASYTYGTYGELLSGSTGLTRFLYNGRCGVITDDNGLYYMRQRYYSPEIKRFVNQDILTGSIGDSRSLNRYSYVQGNPVSYTDPFGLSPLNGLFTGTSFWHGLLGLLGAVPGFVGSIANFIDCGIYLAEGDYFGAALCFANGITLGATATATALLKAGKLCRVANAAVRVAMVSERIAGGISFARNAYNIGMIGIQMYCKYGIMEASVGWETAGEVLGIGFSLMGCAAGLHSMGNTSNELLALQKQAAAGNLCFVAGTKVKTPDGDKNIEDIEAGDEVYACNTETGETGCKQVIRTVEKEAADLAHVTIGGATIDATPSHPFYIAGYGFKPAGELEAGDRVLLLSGETVEVESVTVEHLEKPVRVYNFEVEDWHTYYVEEQGVLVHNDNDCVGSGTGSKFQEIFDLADNYRLSDDTFYNHILDRHGTNSTYGNKSHFNEGFNIKEGIDNTLRGDNFVVGPNTAGREGYIFEQTFSNPIGTSSNGKPLYTLKVVIDEVGNVITAFPKK